MSPSTAFGVGTVLEAGRYSVSGELKNVSVVYSLIFFVYSSSIGWPGSRAGVRSTLAVWAKRDRVKNAGTRRQSFIPVNITHRESPNSSRQRNRQQERALRSAPGVLAVERLAERVGSGAAAGDRDCRYPQVHRHIRVRRPLAQNFVDLHGA